MPPFCLEAHWRLVPAIRMIMKYSNVFPIFFCVGFLFGVVSVFIMATYDVAISRKPPIHHSAFISHDMITMKNSATNIHLNNPGTKYQYYGTPGPAPEKFLRLPPDTTRQLIKINDECELTNCY